MQRLKKIVIPPSKKEKKTKRKLGNFTLPQIFFFVGGPPPLNTNYGNLINYKLFGICPPKKDINKKPKIVNLKKKIYLLHLQKKMCIGATICIGQEIQCLPYSGFFNTYEPKWKTQTSYFLYGSKGQVWMLCRKVSTFFFNFGA